jgi:hypothetical protein
MKNERFTRLINSTISRFNENDPDNASSGTTGTTGHCLLHAHITHCRKSMRAAIEVPSMMAAPLICFSVSSPWRTYVHQPTASWVFCVNLGRSFLFQDQDGNMRVRETPAATVNRI